MMEILVQLISLDGAISTILSFLWIALIIWAIKNLPQVITSASSQISDVSNKMSEALINQNIVTSQNTEVLSRVLDTLEDIGKTSEELKQKNKEVQERLCLDEEQLENINKSITIVQKEVKDLSRRGDFAPRIEKVLAQNEQIIGKLENIKNL